MISLRRPVYATDLLAGVAMVHHSFVELFPGSTNNQDTDVHPPYPNQFLNNSWSGAFNNLNYNDLQRSQLTNSYVFDTTLLNCVVIKVKNRISVIKTPEEMTNFLNWYIENSPLTFWINSYCQ